jgi:hypothetical protein
VGGHALEGLGKCWGSGQCREVLVLGGDSKGGVPRKRERAEEGESCYWEGIARRRGTGWARVGGDSGNLEGPRSPPGQQPCPNLG